MRYPNAPGKSRVYCRYSGTRKLFGSRGPQTSLWDVGKTTHGRHSDAYGVNRRGKSRPELLVAKATKQLRYNFCTTEDEISGERIRKRRSAKHLDFLPSLLEGRRSFQLSYGRVGYIDSKSFIADNDTVLEALTFYRKGRSSGELG